MGLKISGLNELRERLERLRADEVMARALAEQAARMAARVRDGLSEPPGAAGHDEPWLQSGALRDSVGSQADGLQAVVGSSDPAAIPQEMGTAYMPARPFLAPVAAAMGEDVARAVGARVAAALRGDSTDGFDPSGIQFASESGEHPEDPEDVPVKKDLELPGHTHTPQLIPGLNSPVPTIPLLGGGRGPVSAAPRPAAPSSAAPTGSHPLGQCPAARPRLARPHPADRKLHPRHLALRRKQRALAVLGPNTRLWLGTLRRAAKLLPRQSRNVESGWIWKSGAMCPARSPETSPAKPSSSTPKATSGT